MHHSEKKEEKRCLKMGKRMVRQKRSMMYLGVWLDNRRNCTENVKRVIESVEGTTRETGWIFPNISGLRYG